jgi:hypothetical protein
MLSTAGCVRQVPQKRRGDIGLGGAKTPCRGTAPRHDQPLVQRFAENTGNQQQKPRAPVESGRESPGFPPQTLSPMSQTRTLFAAKQQR